MNQTGSNAAALAEGSDVAQSREDRLSLLRSLQKRLKRIKAPSHLPSLTSEFSKVICAPGLLPGNYLPALGQLHNVIKPLVERGGAWDSLQRCVLSEATQDTDRRTLRVTYLLGPRRRPRPHSCIGTFVSILEWLLENEAALSSGIQDRIRNYKEKATRWLQRLGATVGMSERAKLAEQIQAEQELGQERERELRLLQEETAIAEEEVSGVSCRLTAER